MLKAHSSLLKTHRSQLDRQPAFRFSISTQPADDAVERGLAHQGDLDAPWDPRWGAVLLHASFADAMSPEQAARYVRQAVEFEVVTPELIPADAERLPYQVVLTFRRVSSGGFEAISPAVSGALIEIAPPPEPGFTRPRFTNAGGHIFPGDPPRERVGHYSVPVPAAIDPEAEAVDVVEATLDSWR